MEISYLSCFADRGWTSLVRLKSLIMDGYHLSAMHREAYN